MPSPSTPPHKVTLFHERRDTGDARFLEAYIDENGNLVLDGQDIGPSVKDFWGDSDYEYWRHVSAEHVPRVLLELIKDRFSSERAFSDWLEERGIPSTFQSWI